MVRSGVRPRSTLSHPQGDRVYQLLVHILLHERGVFDLDDTPSSSPYCSSFSAFFDRGTKSWRFCVALIVVTMAWGLAFCFIGWFPCFPVEDYWNNPLGTTCYGYGMGLLDETKFAATFETHSATNTVLDLLILSLPIPLFLKNETQSRTRWGIVMLLAAGAM